MKWVRQRCQLDPANTAAMAFFSPPAFAGAGFGEPEVDSSTPLRPRVVNDLRKASQKRMAQKTLHHFSQMKAPSRESRRRQALNLPWPTFVRGRRSGSAWPGGLRFWRRGYSEHRILLVAGLPLYCIAPRQLRILPLLDEGDSIPIRISDDRFSTIPATDGSSVLAYTMVPWRLSHLGTGTRFIVADSIRNLWQKDQAAVMPHRMLEQTTSRNGDWANHDGYQ